MSTDDEETAAYDAGGAGGKFRKSPFRRTQATPYDRPSTVIRNRSWFTKLVVDPASKFINAGAQRFFASLFCKRLPPPVSEKRQESSNVLQDCGPNNDSGVLEPTVLKSSDAVCDSGSNAFSELEQLLMQGTFTRSQIDQMMKLLHSNMVDSPIVDCSRRVENDYSTPAPLRSSGLLEENKTERTICNVTSPTELAKAYMASRPSKVSPSMLSSRSQAVRQDAYLLKTSPYASKSPIFSSANRHSGILGVRENIFNTSRSRGRSSIYMARTPYSRVRATDVKGDGSTRSVFGRPSSSQSMLAHDESFKSKEASAKRRSSVLDDDLGSVGPIRRIRQKPNLSSEHVSGAAKHQMQMQLSQEVSNFVGENQGNRTCSISRPLVPNKSSETAAKILEHLDKLTPKKKSPESKLAALKEKSPSKLTSMLSGDGLKKLAAMASPLGKNAVLHQEFAAPEKKHAYKTSTYEVSPDGVSKGVKSSEEVEQTDDVNTALLSVTESIEPSSNFWNESRLESSNSLANLAPSNTSSLCNGQFSSSTTFSSTLVLASSHYENVDLTSSRSIEATSSTSCATAANIAASTSTSLAAAHSEYSTLAVKSSAPSSSTGALFQSSVDDVNPSPLGNGSLTTQFGSSMPSLVSGTCGSTSFASTSSTTSAPSSERNLSGSSSTMTASVFSLQASSTIQQSAMPSRPVSPFTLTFGDSSMESSSSSDATPGLLNFSSSSSMAASSTATFEANPGNNDHMNMADSMVEDPLQTLAPAVTFGSTVPPLNSFQFGGQQTIAAPESPFRFQATTGGSFSLGSVGNAKSDIKIVKISRNKN